MRSSVHYPLNPKNFKPRLEDPPPPRKSRGKPVPRESSSTAAGIELARSNPGKWVCCAVYGHQGTAQGQAHRNEGKLHREGFEFVSRCVAVGRFAMYCLYTPKAQTDEGASQEVTWVVEDPAPALVALPPAEVVGAPD